jgi:cation:H+ antiporter
MTTLREDLHDVHPGRQRLSIALAVGATVPAVVDRVVGFAPPHPVEALLFGLAIIGAAFLLSWAAEVAQLDVSAGLAIAVLALIAVLPEYGVSFVFAFKGGNAVERFGAACNPPGATGASPCSLVLANMTGANRLLIGVGWSMVVFIAWYRARALGDRRRRGAEISPYERDRLDARSGSGVRLDREHSIELAYLTVATLYSLALPLKRTITLVDAVVLVGIFVAYTVRVSRAPAEEPHLVGPARYLGTFTVAGRRTAVAALFLVSAAIIVLCSEPFADALVQTGVEFGISEFFLVQWLAPLASEAPELLVAGLYAWRLNTNAGLGTLVSSKVNQWTLLVGTLPVVFAIAAGKLSGLPLDTLEKEELFLTAAQSFFAVAVLSNLSLALREAALLFVLFWAQFVAAAVLPLSARGAERVGVAALYLLLGGAILVRDRGRLRALLRDGFRTPYSRLTE